MKLCIDKNCYFLIPTKKNPSPDDALQLVNMFYHSIKENIYIGCELPITMMEQIRHFFTKLLCHDLKIDPSITPYSVGNQYAIISHHYWTSLDNNNTYSDNYDIFHNYSLTARTGIAVFVYNHNQKIIIEIASYYKWDTIDLDELPVGTVVPTFEEFMQNYKPIAIHEISKETAQEWLKQAQDYLDIVEPQFEQWCKEHKDELYTLKEDA